MSERFRRIFPAPRPVIAMAHVPALPGLAAVRRRGGHPGRDRRRRAATSRSSSTRASTPCSSATRTTGRTCSRRRPSHVAAMARIVGELAPDECPFGVDYLWDARAALGVAVATGAAFMREVHARRLRERHGPVAARRRRAAARAPRLRRRRPLRAHERHARVRLAARQPPASGARARSAVVSSLADAILVSGRDGGRRARARDGARGRRGARRQRAGAAQHRRQRRNDRLLRAVHRRRHRRQRPQARRRHLEPRSSASACGASWTPRASA